MKSEKIRYMTKSSVLAAAAFIIMFFEFPLPFFPPYLKIDFSEVPALIAAFALGPVAGVVVELIKNLLHLVMKGSTGGVGELANFMTGASLVLTAGLIYSRNKSKNTAAIGLIAGTLVMALVMSVANYFILIPFYFKVAPSREFIPVILTGIFPFNLIKGILVSIVTLFIYKPLSSIFHR